MVIGVRAHDRNPWVLDRLALQADHYDPMPHVVVADMGSAEIHRDAISAICRRSGFEHVVIPDDGELYSQAVARNAGVRHVKTDFLFLSDVDCIGERDHFRRLANFADSIDLRTCFDQVVILPAYHLGEGASAGIVAAQDAEERHRQIARAMVASVYAGREQVADYVDPFSNVFLCHRAFFELVGGYNESFRGHGSEDFELMVRAQVHSGQLPLPDGPELDVLKPAEPEAYGVRPYRGFRRLGELAAYLAETAGLRIAHLDHPRAPVDSWYRRNDWRRERFAVEIRRTLSGWPDLLELDFLPRPHHVRALLGEDWHAEVLLPLRLEGYRMTVEHAGPGELADAAQRAIGAGHSGGFAVVEPSPEIERRLEEVTRDRGRELIVLGRSGDEGHWRCSLAAADAPPSIFLGTPGVEPMRFRRFVGRRSHDFERAIEVRRFDGTSYAAAKLGVNVRTAAAVGVVADLPERRLPRSVLGEPAPTRARRKLGKLLRDPVRFLADSKIAALRWVARRMG